MFVKDSQSALLKSWLLGYRDRDIKTKLPSLGFIIRNHKTTTPMKNVFICIYFLKVCPFGRRIAAARDLYNCRKHSEQQTDRQRQAT
jgi:hypothetical protein